MEIVGTIVIGIVMACAVAGAVASLFNEEEGLGREFREGIHAIGHIFIPVAGIMASIPYLSQIITAVVGPAFASLGSDPAMAATAVIAVDMGGYQLADVLSVSREGWLMAMITGYMAGATIVFSIPVGLSLLEKRDHKYMALGVLSGILSIPIGVLITTVLVVFLDVAIRPTVSTDVASTYTLTLSAWAILINLVPLFLFVICIALGLHFFSDMMIRGFMIFGRLLDAAIKLVLVFSIVEYFTGLFSIVFGSWGFDPIIADSEDQFRALEIAGYIGVMLSGAFPMVYLIRKHLARPMELMGRRIGLEPVGAAGLLAAAANILAMFRLIREMPAKDKVVNIAFSVCAAFMLGDHLAFTANFQPNLILPIILGKLGGGIFAIVLAFWLSVPKAIELEKGDALPQESPGDSED